MGNAPSVFDNSVFSDCDANFTILVPDNNDTWASGNAFDGNNSTWNGYPIESYHVHSYSPNITNATCTEQGYTTYVSDGNATDTTTDDGGNFFSKLLDSIKNIFKSLFSWLPFC